ncbi:MAG: class I SAM-dependent methyltransferase [Flavobacteriales bacterium]|jgi:SAM-dependent methyltransferase|nr:class I SAM-dependent methyltransferase [Flavobacteriales bacterium]MBK6548949.1 class I SAM-dependent methyltransferase [Flavobacteriales bacterium]MBK6884459.1 class I SAM-dependent methyltransferase [Flavobacteriales bacterium]MBK7100854.1 class I SAM-dependent methyltransferase [Flavobacteriales bacterium]MBK7111541.1 class I SAM-dependent methyltransferase [Flavobacteriales bacterium]
MGWFKHWFGTRYYALLYGHRDADDAQTWVEAIVDRWELPKGSKVLDLACGRGRHARFFALAGLDVTGIDISGASIAEARALVPEVEFRVHDMREPYAHGVFDGVCCLFTSLGYFDGLEDDRAVFRAAHAALKPGGRFILDFMNSELTRRELVATETLSKKGVQFNLARTYEDGVFVKRIKVSDQGEDHLFEERVQALSATELEEMAIDAGFTIDDRTDGPALLPFDPLRSQRFVLWMRKPIS